jgi:hypothetical protein
VLTQRVELALACSLGVLHDLPTIVLPGAIFPIGTAGAERDVLAPPGKGQNMTEPRNGSPADWRMLSIKNPMSAASFGQRS